jgi:hypothetical protein
MVKAQKAGIPEHDWLGWVRSLEVKTNTRDKKKLEALEKRVDDWIAAYNEAMDQKKKQDSTENESQIPDGPPEEYGKMFVSPEQIDHLIETAKISNPDFSTAQKVLDFCKGALKNFDLQELEQLTVDDYEGLLEILNTRTGDQAYVPLEERGQS